MKTKTIGQVIHPSWSYDLESSLRVHSMLVERALAKKWRFKGQWVVTGPFETLMGKSGCGSSHGDTSWCELGLFVRDGVEAMTKQVNRLIFSAMCSYPDFADINERVPEKKLVHTCDAVKLLAAYEGGRTRRQMNSHWKKATLVKDVRLECKDDGIRLAADVSFNMHPAESSWPLWYLEKSPSPKWPERLRLATWMERAAGEIGRLVRKKAGEP